MKMESTWTAIVFMVCFAAVHAGWSEASKEESLHTEYVQIYDVTDHTTRLRRSAEGMPDSLHFRVAMSKGDVTLRLKRSSRMSVRMPVFVIRGKSCKKEYLPLVQDADVYTDRTQAAAFLVKQRQKGVQERKFQLEGTMVVNGTEYLVSADHDMLALPSTGSHVLRQLAPNVSFGEDMLVAPDNEVPMAEPQGSNVTVFPPTMPTTPEVPQVVTAPRRPWENWGFGGRRDGPRRFLWRRGKRQVSEHTVELLMVADYAAFNHFLKASRSDVMKAKSEMRLYYAFVASAMDLRYKSVTDVDPSLKINVVPVGLVISETAAAAKDLTEDFKDSSDPDKVNAGSALRSFVNWKSSQRDLPDADHFMLFTGYNMENGGRSSVIGLAYVNTFCGRYSTSIIEDYFSGKTASVSAHELGHSLSASHDGRYDGCQDSDYYVMAAGLGSPRDERRRANPWRFSSCSVNAFRNKLERTSCGRQVNSRETIQTAEVAGQYLHADAQCQLKFGPGSYFCRSSYTSFDEMCLRLYCSVPGGGDRCTSIVAEEYTSCGDGMWCEKSYCIRNARAPSKIDDCPQGDAPGFSCQRSQCPAYSASYRRNYCCETCYGPRRITPPSFTAPAAPTTPVATTTTPTTTTTTPTTTTTTPTTDRPVRQVTTPSPVATTLSPQRVSVTLQCLFNWVCRTCLLMYFRGDLPSQCIPVLTQ